MLILIIALDFIGVYLAIWRGQTRGQWNRHLNNLGGIIWLIGVIWGFISQGWLVGGVILLGTFVLARIFMSILPQRR